MALWTVTTGNWDDRADECETWIVDGTEEDAEASLLDYNTVTYAEDPESEFTPTSLEELAELGIWWAFRKAAVLERKPDGTFVPRVEAA